MALGPCRRLILGYLLELNLWNSIIDNFNRKFAGWKGATLSQAGKCSLVKFILQNLPTYALSLFGIPVKFAERMERIQRDFLWTGTDDHKRYHLVSWDLVCLPKSQGGLGIRKISHLNQSLLAKHPWRIFQSTGVWRDILAEKYLGRLSLNSIFQEAELPMGSYIWNGILKALPLAKSRAKWKVGMGDKILFWQDSWLCEEPLINHPIFGRWADQCIGRYGLMVRNYRNGNEWHNLADLSQDLKPLMSSLNAIFINQNGDSLVWGDSSGGLYSVASGYLSLVSKEEKPIWAKAWIPGLTPKINIFLPNR